MMIELCIAGILLIGQILVVITLLRITRTFGAYAEKLLQTHNQNIRIRQNLATIENEIAAREALRKYPFPKEERA
jgi:hypothetical protein